MFPRLARTIVVLLTVQLLGGHWAVLQTTAWVKMVVSFSQQGSLAGAIEKTFDGDHPCDLCKVVKKGHSEEQQQQVAKMVVKLDAVLVATLQVPLQQAAEWHYGSDDQRRAARTFAPPTPPPLRA